MYGNWWEKFHKLWGKNSEGRYDKLLWGKLQFILEQLESDLLRVVAVEPDSSGDPVGDHSIRRTLVEIKEKHFSVLCAAHRIVEARSDGGECSCGRVTVSKTFKLCFGCAIKINACQICLARAR